MVLFFLIGECKFGDKCRRSHDVALIPVCNQFQSEGCTRNPCRYRHQRPEDRPAVRHYKHPNNPNLQRRNDHRLAHRPSTTATTATYYLPRQ